MPRIKLIRFHYYFVRFAIVKNRTTTQVIGFYNPVWRRPIYTPKDFAELQGEITQAFKVQGGRTVILEDVKLMKRRWGFLKIPKK